MCLNEGSITIPPYAPPQKMQTHLIPQDTPRSIFVYFRGLFYDINNDPEGGYYARYVCTKLSNIIKQRCFVPLNYMKLYAVF